MDAAGRVVKRFSGLKPGENLIRWDGTDSKGSPLMSGVYFVVMKASRKHLRSKFILWR